MKNLLPLILIGFVLASCSPAPRLQEGANLPVASEMPLGNQGVSGPATGGPASLPGSNPLAVTVHPPAIPIGPVQGGQLPPGVITPPSPALKGWQTFTSAGLGVTVDYPPDWSVAEQADGATFTSPQGMAIQLQVVNAGTGDADSSTANQECTPLINAYGLSLETCGDSASHHYSAQFHLIRADGSTEQLRLSTSTQETLDVYKAMLNLLRPA